MAQFGEKLQNQIEPVIRDFIDCMEPGTPRVEIESYRREDLRNTLCSRPDLEFHLKVMSDICDGFWMILFYSGDFGILLKKKTLQIAFLTVHHLFWTRFSLQPTYKIIWKSIFMKYLHLFISHYIPITHNHLLSYLPVEEISNLAEYFYNADKCEKFWRKVWHIKLFCKLHTIFMNNI